MQDAAALRFVDWIVLLTLTLRRTRFLLFVVNLLIHKLSQTKSGDFIWMLISTASNCFGVYGADRIGMPVRDHDVFCSCPAVLAFRCCSIVLSVCHCHINAEQSLFSAIVSSKMDCYCATDIGMRFLFFLLKSQENVSVNQRDRVNIHRHTKTYSNVTHVMFSVYPL